MRDRWLVAGLVLLCGCGPEADGGQAGGALAVKPDVGTAPSWLEQPGYYPDATARRFDDAGADGTSAGAPAGPACQTVDDCPAAASACATPACVDGSCQVVAAEDGLVCEQACAFGPVCHAGACVAQAELTLDRTLPTPGTDELRDLTVVPGFGYLLVGRRTDATGARGLAVRISPTGNVVWEKTLDAWKVTELVAVEHDGDGVVVAGSTAAYAFVAKLGLDGQILWSNAELGLPGAETLVLTRAPDGWLLAGRRGGLGWAAKVTPTGAPQLEGQYGQVQLYQRFDAAATLPDGWVLAGESKALGTQGQGYVVRTDLAGKALWSKTWPTTHASRFRAVMPLSGGDVLLAGAFQTVDPDAWLVRMSSDGKVVYDYVDVLTGGFATVLDLAEDPTGAAMAVLVSAGGPLDGKGKTFLRWTGPKGLLPSPDTAKEPAFWTHVRFQGRLAVLARAEGPQIRLVRKSGFGVGLNACVGGDPCAIEVCEHDVCQPDPAATEGLPCAPGLVCAAGHCGP